MDELQTTDKEWKSGIPNYTPASNILRFDRRFSAFPINAEIY